MLNKYPGHPILTFVQNLSWIITVFGAGFGIYALACLYWLRPADMDVAGTQNIAMICGLAFLVACPISIMANKIGKKRMSEHTERRYKDLRKKEETL